MSAKRTAIATVCLSGTLEDKLVAASAAGFDGVEVFEPDLVGSAMSPGEIRVRCADLGLSIDLYQPFRDLDSTHPERFAANLRRAERKFAIMTALGTSTMLVCSSVSPDAVADDNQLAEQLRALAELASTRGLRIAYEALAWGREVSTYERSWEVVARADHPALGLCLDSFHILSRGGDPAGITKIPGDRLFFLQLADAPRLSMDVLQWSRHHRLFPGQGGFDLPAFVEPVLEAGYRGPLSLEVFNDVFRQADPARTAVDAHRSLLALTTAVAARRPDLVSAPVAPPAPELTGHAFTELAVDDVSGPQLAHALTTLGFSRTGRHRSKAVDLWEQGDARVLLNATGDHSGAAAITAVAVESTEPLHSERRAQALHAPLLHRSHGVGEADLSSVAAPDGSTVFFCRSDADAGWRADFRPTGAAAGPGVGITGIDHIALTQPFDFFDEAALFYREVLGLRPQSFAEFAAPFGLVRARALANESRSVRIALTVSLLRRGNWAPRVTDPQHIAFATNDVFATVRAVRSLGGTVLAMPDNYYEDLDARLAPPPEQLATMRELGVLHEADQHGTYLRACTEVFGGRVFFELVQRIDDYDGYGWTDAPVQMAAHRRQRSARQILG